MLSQNAKYLLSNSYCKYGEEPEDVYRRVVNYLFDDDATKDRMYNLMTSGTLLPNSPCIHNSGNEKSILNACFVLPIDDDIGAIFDTVTNMAKIFHYGGGVGINFSPLREKDSPLKSGGTSSGVVSFMNIFDSVTDTVKQGGYRRGALMGCLDYSHPEIFRFINAKLKGRLQNFNISVCVDDLFMNCIKSGKEIPIISPKKGVVDSVKAKDIFDVIAFSAWSNGDPGLLFLDTINNANKLFPEIRLSSTNPCGEMPLPSYGACCLGSINLGKFVRDKVFNYDKFVEVIHNGMKMLDAVNKKSWFPIPEITETVNKLQSTGLGWMGFADALIKMEIYYDSQECLDFIDSIGKVFEEETDNYDEVKRFTRRSIAPTGSLSILANCSSGIEPIFDSVFERHLTVGVIEETRDIYKSPFVRTAHQVSPEWHVRIQAQIQKWIDSAVSKTVNLPHNASVDDVKYVYMLAWELGCKGITTFRDQSKDSQVLYSTKKQKCSDEECYL